MYLFIYDSLVNLCLIVGLCLMPICFLFRYRMPLGGVDLLNVSSACGV